MIIKSFPNHLHDLCEGHHIVCQIGDLRHHRRRWTPWVIWCGFTHFDLKKIVINISAQSFLSLNPDPRKSAFRVYQWLILINASTRILKLTYLCICVVMGHVFNVSSESRYIHSHFLLHSKLLEDNVVTWKAFFQIGLNPNKFSGKRLLLWEQKTMASYIITITVMSASPNYFFYSSRLVESSSKKEGGYPRAFHQRFGPLMTSFPCAGRESWDS